MHIVPMSSDFMKQVGLDPCSLLELDGYHQLIACINYFTKWLEAKPITDKKVLALVTFLYQLMFLFALKSKNLLIPIFFL